MTKYSVKKPFTVLVGVVLVLVLGVVSFLGLNTDLLPNIDLPYVVVYTVYPGASPERVELSVTKPLEQAVATTSGLENMSSISSENMSIIILEFSQSTNMDSAMLELSSNVDMVTGYFDDMVQSPVMMKINPDMLPVQMLSVDVDGMDIKELTEYVENDLAPRLERIDGVATVDVSGSVSDHVDIVLNQDKIDDINDQILKSVNSTLYKTKKELDDAQKKLTDGKTELENKSKEAYEKLADASAQLDAGQAQAQAIAADKTKLEAQKKMLEGAQQALQALSQMRGMSSAVSGLISMGYGDLTIQEIMNKIPDAITLIQQITGLDDINDATTLNDIIAAKPEYAQALGRLISRGIVDGDMTVGYLTGKLPNIKAVLQGLIDSGMFTADMTLNQVKLRLAEKEKQLEETLKSLGVSQDIIDKADADWASGEIATVELQIAQTELMAKQMADTIKKLQESYARLEKTKMETTAQLAAASVQIDSAQRQLDSGIKEFETARDAALKNANIDQLVTQDMLSTILVAQNFSMPAGYIRDGNEKLTVKVGDVFSTLDQLENLLLVDMDIDGIDPIYLKDVADISINDNSEESYVRVNGNPGVMLSIQKSSTASTSRVSKSVNSEMESLMEENSAVHITQLMDQGIYIEMVVNSVMENLIYGGLIALAVLVVFLKDLKPTMIIGLSIPISLLFAIVMMYFSGVTLNIISLSGLALGVGMLVDNSIVVIENVYRLRNLGYSKVRAAVEGAGQVGGAIASSTLTTICVFVPIVFTEGITRQLFTDMGLTIAYSLIASLIVALTVVPAMASNMLTSTKEAKPGFFEKMVSAYEKALDWNLKHKWVVIVLTTSLLAYSAYCAFKMPMAFIPDMDSTQMQMTLTLPSEASQDELIEKSELIAERVRQIEGVETVGMTTGSTGISSLLGGSSSGNSMSFYVVLSEDKDLTNNEIARVIKEQNPEFDDTLTVTASTMDLSALGGSGISVVIKGNDLDILQEEADKIAQIISNVEGVDTVDNGAGDDLEEIRIDVDKEKAMSYGLTVAQVYQKVSAALTDSTTATTLTLDGTDMSAIIHASTTYSRETIGSLPVAVKTENGKEKDVLLREIASVYTAQSPKGINHSNQSRYKTVSASIQDGYNVSLVSRDVETAMKEYSRPKGYSWEMSGENETIMSAMTDMIKMIALAIVFIYLIMVAQFQSLLSPFIVLFTIPLAFTGGLLALKMTGEMLTITSMIGFLVLAGVVVNNGIVFVDYVNGLRLEGVDKHQALLQTGKDRIRPILMTALTTILAMSTMALGVGMGAELSKGMAMVTIGGLTYSTLLTLFLVPALYDIFNRKEIKSIEVDFEEEKV